MTEWERAMHRNDILDALASYQEVWSYAAGHGAPYVDARESAVLVPLPVPLNGLRLKGI
jgi:hypothetical protein